MRTNTHRRLAASLACWAALALLAGAAGLPVLLAAFAAAVLLLAAARKPSRSPRVRSERRPAPRARATPSAELWPVLPAVAGAAAAWGANSPTEAEASSIPDEEGAEFGCDDYTHSPQPYVAAPGMEDQGVEDVEEVEDVEGIDGFGGYGGGGDWGSGSRFGGFGAGASWSSSSDFGGYGGGGGWGGSDWDDGDED